VQYRSNRPVPTCAIEHALHLLPPFSWILRLNTRIAHSSYGKRSSDPSPCCERRLSRASSGPPLRLPRARLDRRRLRLRGRARLAGNFRNLGSWTAEAICPRKSLASPGEALRQTALVAENPFFIAQLLEESDPLIAVPRPDHRIDGIRRDQ
jgi:hypothetical protein